MAQKAYSDTEVASNKSKEQIEKLLRSHAVTAVRFTSLPSFALLEFVHETKDKERIPYRITIQPKVNRLAQSAGRELDRAERQVWRVAYWYIKSKFEAIDFGLVEFQQEFLPHMLLQSSNGRSGTVYEIFTERLVGRVTTDNDIFGGLLPQKGTEDSNDRQ